jgi:hypothetical protein
LPQGGLPFLGGLFGGGLPGGAPQGGAQPGAQPLFGGLLGGIPRDQQSMAAFAGRAQDMLAGGQTGISGLLNLFMGGALPQGASFHEGVPPARDPVSAYFQRNPSPGARAGMLGNAAQRAAPVTRNRPPSFGIGAGGKMVKF